MSGEAVFREAGQAYALVLANRAPPILPPVPNSPRPTMRTCPWTPGPGPVRRPPDRRDRDGTGYGGSCVRGPGDPRLPPLRIVGVSPGQGARWAKAVELDGSRPGIPVGPREHLSMERIVLETRVVPPTGFNGFRIHQVPNCRPWQRACRGSNPIPLATQVRGPGPDNDDLVNARPAVG